jgi:hypothetical protein
VNEASVSVGSLLGDRVDFVGLLAGEVAPAEFDVADQDALAPVLTRTSLPGDPSDT